MLLQYYSLKGIINTIPYISSLSHLAKYLILCTISVSARNLGTRGYFWEMVCFRFSPESTKRQKSALDLPARLGFLGRLAGHGEILLGRGVSTRARWRAFTANEASVKPRIAFRAN